MAYTIRHAASRLGVSPSTLRFYEKEGLLPFVARSSSGIRIFTESDLSLLQLIGCLKATNMPLRDIKAFVDWFMEGDGTLEQRRDMFYERRQAVEQQIAALQKTLDTINYKCWYYDTAVQAGTVDVHARMKPEDIPDDIRKLKEIA